MDYFNLTDKLLVERIINNDSKAVTYLLQYYCNNLFRYIKYSVFKNSFIEVDDLKNEFYLFLQENEWKKLKEFEFRSKLATWLSVVAIRYFRKKYKTLLIDSINLQALNNQNDNIIHDFSAETYVNKIDVLDAINKMGNPVHKKILYLLEIEGYEPDEVAKKLNTTVSNIYNMKSRAKKELYSLLNEDKSYEK